VLRFAFGKPLYNYKIHLKGRHIKLVAHSCNVIAHKYTEKKDNSPITKQTKFIKKKTN